MSGLDGKLIDGRYEIIQRMAEGGMGVLYRVRHLLTGREEALKLLRSAGLGTEEERRRFLVEATAVARLRSPYTVTLYDCGQTAEGLLYFTMELLEGSSVKETLDSSGALHWERAVRLASQVCRSLAEAHEKGIVHRDIKPSNIFLVLDPEDGERAKVLDFGIARVVAGGVSLGSTMPGTLLGTPLYMSPEQFRGEEPDEKTDIYSLGAVLYEMISGRPPFKGATWECLREQHVNELPLPPSVRPGMVALPDGLVALVMQCLSKSRAQRPASARDLGARLDGVSGLQFPGMSSGHVGEGLPGESTISVPGRASPPVLGNSPGAVEQQETVDAHDAKPPLAGWPSAVGGRRWYAAARYSTVGLCALATTASLVLPLLAPVRWLDEQGEAWRQVLNLAPDAGRSVVVTVGGEDERVTLAAQGHPVPGRGADTWRRLDAELLDRLSGAGAAVVAFDKYYGRDHPEETSGLAGSVERSVERGTSVVVGALDMPPPAVLTDAGATAGAVLAAESGFDGTVTTLLSTSRLTDGSNVPSLFVRVYCLLREPPEEPGKVSPAGRECEERVVRDGERWLVRYRFVPPRQIRLSDLLAWPKSDVERLVRNRAVFVGHVEEGHDQVKVPPGLSIPQDKEGIHGVLLLALAFDQLDRYDGWYPLSRAASTGVFLLLGLLPALLLRRWRWPSPQLVTLFLLGSAAMAGLLWPVRYPWGAGVTAGLAGLVAMMTPQLAVRLQGRRIARDLAECLNQLRRGPVNESWSGTVETGLSEEVSRVLETPVVDEATAARYVGILQQLVNGRDAGGLFYEREPASFFKRRGWLATNRLPLEAPPRTTAVLSPSFVGVQLALLQTLWSTDGADTTERKAKATVILEELTGRKSGLSARHWLQFQRSLGARVVEYLREMRRALL
jgi:serine/threonine-protein kinase